MGLFLYWRIRCERRAGFISGATSLVLFLI